MMYWYAPTWCNSDPASTPLCLLPTSYSTIVHHSPPPAWRIITRSALTASTAAAAGAATSAAVLLLPLLLGLLAIMFDVLRAVCLMFERNAGH